MKTRMQLSKKYIILGLLPAIAIGGLFYSNFQTTENNFTEVPRDSPEAKFILLSNAKTNLCSSPNFLDSQDDGNMLQGSCCTKMDFDRYMEQTEGLKEYSSINVIPSDPYNIPVSLAKKLIDYRKTITLNPQQQMVYNDAMNMSYEGGPCCCKCWRWYAFDGQAKYLITEYNFDAKQIAHVWDIEDGCGGKGHEGHFQPQS